MYSTEDEQEPNVKQPQKASKIPGGSDNESPQETSPGEPTNRSHPSGILHPHPQVWRKEKQAMQI